ASHGAMILTYCDAESVERGRVTVRDALGGGGFDIAARHVVNASGVWADALAPGVRLVRSKGAHVIVRAQALGNPRAALVVPVPGESARTADLSRKHAIVEDRDSGVITVVGGKLTTYRHMAQQTVDRLLKHDPRACRTARLPLVGAAPHDVLRSLRAPARLIRRYG